MIANQTGFEFNYAANGGGFASAGTLFSLFSSHMTSNSATYGGGVYISGSFASTFIECKWFKNVASHRGGGVYATGSDALIYLQAHVFLENTVALNSYRDIFVVSGTIDISNGCAQGLHNYGTDLLWCYGCSSTYPADLNHTHCKPWSSSFNVKSERELAVAVMHNSTINLLNDVTVLSEVAVVGFNLLTGAVFDGDGVFTIYASQGQQQRRSLLTSVPTRYMHVHSTNKFLGRL
jgi:predicted outer membrane repeat protein